MTADVTPIQIEPTLGFQLGQACRAHRNRMDAALAQIGLHTGQELLLLRLAVEEGCRQSDLVAEMCVQPATITKSLDRLEAGGLVERRPDGDDRRVSRVYLTCAGRALHQRILQAWQEVEQASFAGMTQEERIVLRRLLLQVRDNLGKQP